ncbi:filamentous hemagglutinin family outer membrane protein [Richelia sinica FACHB-800]|uniref:Filamentous hemagglutinin family outer membrane protein n=1 Tax=Richelia sinica FACHB-800 TaxID=1357546 RepID=A0A975Y764_9NOST|nr:filamentous hemagglutinin N-terminal domain-containing protein [Richelia sinica]MBD2667346.1 filamentous hemagglutinin N-terminal domain-containing protein [Richelia sinica FACHB-800]QXE26011.1 filamentous hemagglutinin family outer membrane protein [Richelia sinica FACHB-800]
MNNKKQWLAFPLGITFLLLEVITNANQSVLAQLKPDGTLNSAVKTIEPLKEVIHGGTTKGANLFHSFQEFNISPGTSVYFANPVGIENILTRVTGSNPSQILGKLGVDGIANLFLMNPNGIFFGKGAIVDVRGSFTATTADRIKLGDHGIFSATELATNNLLIIKPNALFINSLKNHRSAITNHGNLTVGDGSNITLLSANVTNKGTLNAPGGVIQLIGTKRLITRGNINTETLILTTKNLTIGEDNTTTINQSTLEGLSGNTNLIFQAANNININSLKNQTLNLADGHGQITFTADADSNGIGNFQMNRSDTIKTNGRNISISGANLILGNLDTFLVKKGEVIAEVDIDAGGAIPPNENEDTAIFTFTVTEEMPIENLSVQFSAAHTYNEDLEVSLISPSPLNTELELFKEVGREQNNFQDTLLDESAGIRIDSVNTRPPFRGTFKPTGLGGLAVFNGYNPKGTWKLKVKDHYPGEDSGTVYKAGEIAPWGKADGTKLIFSRPTTYTSGLITLNALNGNINVGNINTGNIGGKILLNAVGNIYTESITSPAFAFSGTVKNGGTVSLIAGGNIFTKDINASSRSFEIADTAGDGGNISLTAGGNIFTQILKSESYSESKTGISGNGGDISLSAGGNIWTHSLSSSSVSIPDSAPGVAKNGGNISLTAGGDISTEELSTYSFSTGTAGNAGKITLTAKNGDIQGRENKQIVPVFSSFSVSKSGVSGQGGNVTLVAKNQITNLNILTWSSNSKSGDVDVKGLGNLLIENTNLITSKKVNFRNTRTGKVEELNVGEVGQSGNVNITSLGNLTLNQSRIESDTKGSDPAGNVTITSAGNLIFNHNSKIIGSTSSSGKAGNIHLNIRDDVILTGKNSGLFANTEIGSIGDSGSINITAENLMIKNGAGIGVNSRGSGKGGNISVQASNLSLNNGLINAETAANQGGNIHLNIQDVLLMRNHSRITASAGTDKAGGDGGNININAPLLVAFPQENSDITANAFQGKGGNINITTNEIFGLEFRPQQTGKSDITASSELGVNGNVQIKTPGVDPTAGIVELPAVLVDAESLVAKNICDVAVIRESSFVITGKGGLPAASQDVIANAPGLVEWVNPGENENTVPVVVSQQSSTEVSSRQNSQRLIQQAQGWIVTADGKVILTAEVPTTTLQTSNFIPPSCISR